MLGSLEHKEKDSERKNQRNFLQFLSIFLILFGILIRLVQYIHNRSLWFDEVNLALNIIDRSYLELLNTLDDNQAAPPGFLWIEKLATQLLGNNEYALRLFPFVSGIVSLFAFYLLARRFSSAIAAPIAIALFATAKYTVYYTIEAKQYSSDVMIALLLSLLLIPLGKKILNYREILKLSSIGVICIWISHPAVFVLAGIELYYFLSSGRRKWKSILINRFIIYVTWLVSFILLYFLTIAKTLSNESLVSSWSSRYPDSFFDIIWLFDALGRFFYRPLGFSTIIDGVGMVAFIFGCIAYYRRNRETFWILLSPLIATIIASYLHKYPFRERLVLFLAPFAFLIIAEGIAYLLTTYFNSRQNKSSKCFKYKYTKMLGIVLLLTLLLPSVIRGVRLVINPEVKHEIRPVIAYVASQQQKNDVLYVYAGGKQQLLYYGQKYGYQEEDYISGIHAIDKDEIQERDWEELNNEIKQLDGIKRIWFVGVVDNQEEESLFISFLDRLGKQLDSFQKPGAFAYLYDLSR